MVKPGEVVWANVQCKGDPPTPRSGHTITGNGTGKCIVFGGCGIQTEDAHAVFNDTHILTLGEPGKWELVDPLGDVPSPRWRHTATLLPDEDGVLVFGGLCRGKRFNDTHVFSIDKREWSIKECAGTPPHPRSHHTANRLDLEPEEAGGGVEHKLVILGGYGGPGTTRDFYLDLNLLELSTWTWVKVEAMKGAIPTPRSDHTAALADGKLILYAGRGWTTKTDPGYFADMHILDLRTYRWLEPEIGDEDASADAEEGVPTWPSLGESMWNHSAMAIQSVPSSYMFLFGGQNAPRRYSNSIAVFDTGRHKWETPKTVTGTPPPAREDSPFAYDESSKCIVLFGGWRQKWLDDVWTLNVAGICGPPYAVKGISPQSGPYTGQAPVIISGLLFKESGRINVKFSTKDGKREMVVPGKFEDVHHISCKTPNFEKHGALEVNVAVSIEGEPYTVNECAYQFYLNTSAKRCVAFGPGLAPSNEVGRTCSFVIQTKDSAGHYRASGGDPLRVVIAGPSGEKQPPAIVEDTEDGRYRISYWVPVAGDYQVSIFVDENPNDHSVESEMLVQGCPFKVHFEDVWTPTRVVGVAPRVRPHMEVAVIDGKLTVVPLNEDMDLTGAKADAVAFAEADERARRLAERDSMPTPADAAAEGGEAAAADGNAAATADSGADGAGVEGKPASTEAAGQEEAAGEEDAADADAGQGGDAPPKPGFAWQLDMATGLWVIVEGEETVGELLGQVRPSHDAHVRDVEAFCATAKVPDALRDALMHPARFCASFAVAGTVPADGSASEGTGEPTGPLMPEVPAPRSLFEVHISGEMLLLYGGRDADGALCDELWQLNKKGNWTQLYAAELDRDQQKGRLTTFHQGAIVELLPGSLGDSLGSVRRLPVESMQRGSADEDVVKAMLETVNAQMKEKEELTRSLSMTLAQADKADGGDNVQLLYKVKKADLDVRTRGEQIDLQLEQLAETVSYLQSVGAIPADQLQQKQAKLEQYSESWTQAKKMAPTVRKAIKQVADAQGGKIADQVAAFRQRTETFAGEMRSSSMYNFGNGIDKAYSALDNFNKEVLKLETEVLTIKQSTDTWEMSESLGPAQSVINSARTELNLVKTIWDMVAVVNSTLAHWQGTLWESIDTGSMEEECKLFAKTVRTFDKSTREWDVYKGLDQIVKNFLAALPCVGDLKSPSMRERHWRQLMEITGKEIPLPFPPDFALRQLLELQLHKFVDDVGEVVDRAVKEDKMEQQLAKLSMLWYGRERGKQSEELGPKAICFEFDQHRDTDIYLIRMAEENFDALEENQLLVQGMMASKYLATFEEEVTRWQRELSNVSDVLTLMSEVQRRWAYLETLFIGSEEVKRELPEDAERFVGIDAKFKVCLAGIHEVKNAVVASNRAGLLDDLNDMSANLELCEKSLADFLESKKRIFPRFYFVATAMLLDILSNGNRPAIVAQNINALLQGVKALELTGDNSQMVQSMTSNEGEVVPYSKTGALELKGKVEIYLNDLIDKVRHELRTQLGIAIKDYRGGGRKRSEWLFDHVAQLVLVTTQIEWTENTELAFDKLEKGDKSALPTYSEQQIDMLSDLIKLVQGKLDKLQRRKIMNMITLETHSRDINLMLIRDEVESKDNFKWMGQLKTYWIVHGDSTDPDCWIFNCDAQFNYSYEYLGNAGRLVITPLTDRIYTTATQACHLVLGCAPAGPAGTGKTETTKDLSAQLGKAVYVVNCGPEMDYRTMGDQFKGLASAGAWGCFDEYNRLLAEVLSVNSIQYKAVLDATRSRSKTFRMEGVDYSLHPDGCMAFITMNPGYLGRTELPESLKVLFRPVTVMVPDMQMIMENMLMAEGYTTANTLAKKFFTLYRLLKDLLSPQMHYDWGLRAIKSVLVVAGGFKRGEPDKPEGGLLMRALRDFNLPKIVEDDMVVFMGLLKDLWPDVFDSMPRKRDYEFEALVTSVSHESNLQASEYFVQNVVDLQDLLDIRHCVFEIGSSGNNKTKTWQTLAKVWTKGGVRGKTTFRDINPKAITPNELYGYVNMATREWKDGLLSSTMREMANQPDTNPKWIILDGDLDANWIENMNSVMDDNRLLTLASNERIRLLTHMRMIFEIRDLAYASPATVTRAGILFISELAQWKNFVKSWIADFKENEAGSIKPDMRTKRAEALQALFDKYCEPTMDVLRRDFKPVVPILDFNMVQTLCYFLEGLLTEENVGRDDSKFEIYFVLAAVWAFGSFFTITSGTDYRKKFSGWWKDQWKTIKFPHRGEVFDFFVDKEKCEFAAWADIVPTINYSSTTPMSAVTVPTGETVALTFWLDNLMPRKHPAMLLGAAGCGKTAIINGKLRSLGEDYLTASVNINYYTNSSLFLKILEAPLEKKAGKNYGPPGSKKLVYFVDDLNMAALDKYNTASNIALMRQHCAYGHVYDMTKLTQKVLLNTQYLAAMNPTAGSFVVNPRLQRLFATFAVGFPGAEALTTIYQTFLNGHIQVGFSRDIDDAEMGKRIVQAALQLHRKVAATFRKTASNFHYEFNIRHMAGVFQGILMGKGDVFKEPLQLAQLWLHESERVYGDRLVSVQDLKKYKDLAAEVAKKIFKEMSPMALMAEPLIVCHFAQGVGDKIYDRVSSFADLSTTLTQALNEYNETNAVMNLVLFEDAIRHVCRISRIIESPGGHALLVGVGGSGKQSLSRLAAYASAFTVFQVVISATYGINELKADLQAMYRKSGLKGEQMAFLFTDQQIADERFLVYLNDMLSSGDVPGLFPPEDQDDIVNAVRPMVKRSGLADSRENCWAYFISQVRANLHVVLCFSPVGDPIKVRTRRFPALVNCVVIDWFQPWPEDALFSVSKRFLGEMELGTPEQKEAVIGFMPYSFVAVNDASRLYIEQERRYNWTTPKSFLELIALYKAMLQKRRDETNGAITRLSNGVTKLEKTAKEVGQLEEDLKLKQVEVEEKKIQCDAMIPKLDAEKGKAADEAAKANVIASAAAEKEVAVGEMKVQIEKDLAAAEPALLKAAAALDSLNKKDLGELKSLAKPPAGIDDVTAACVYLLHPGGKGKIDASWKASQQMMKDVNKFLDELLTFKDKIDNGEVPKQNFKNIRPLLEKEWFNVDTMRTKSAAAAGLCDWVLNITVYWDINENVEPMREAAANAVTQLEEAIKAKEAAIKSKEAAEATVAELTKAFNEAVAEKEAVIAEAEACMRKLGLAQRLMAALGSEGERWKSTVASLTESLPILVGDALLASAFVSYNGCFNRYFREMLTKKKFVPYLLGELPVAKGGVPMGADPDPLKILTNDAEIASWSNEGLPTDRISVENGTIVTNCARWPLMIDPQLQGVTWIKKREERRGLHIVRLGQKQLIPKLENALENGKPIVIENVQTTIDAVLAPVIGRQVTRRGRTVFVKLGDKEVDYHPDFKLYLQTKLSNPHYPPEIQAECTLINFMVTEDGLEDQLLALTVLKERPDLEEQKAVLIAQMNGFKIKTKELEDGILEQLANAEGDILENIALIENLEDSKRVSLEIAEKAKVAQVTEVEINTAREMYRRVAARGSLMFFLLATLNKVHTFYHFSLSSFNTIVERAITGRRGKLVWNEEAVMSNIAPAKLKRAILDEAAERKKAIVADTPEVLEERMNFLVDNITFKVFDATRRGLLERHKLILATQLLLKVMSKAGELNDAEADYLISGRSSMSPPQMTAKVQEFLTPKQWANACALKEVDAFKNVTEDLELQTDGWSEWLEFERPEQEELPGEWEKRLNSFQKLLVLRALRQDRVTTALTHFIETRLGARYTNQEPFDMDDTFNDSSFKQPLFFVLFPGVDPGVAIERLGRKLGFTAEEGNYVSISMGQGQEKNAENTIDRFANDGGWVFLQNIHLMSTWLPTLDRKLEIVAENGHEDFRAFLSAEPPPALLEHEMQTVPEGVLQASVKVANEPPTDLKATLRSSYALFDQPTLEKSTKPKAHRPMIFTLAFFHSLVLGRRKFGFQGFSRNYPFNNGDITVCADVLNNYVEARENLPWADLKYIWGEIMYGGHITDSWDRRCMSAYLEVLLVDELVDEKEDFYLAPGFRPLLEGDFNAYRAYIEDAMPAESPTLFGLHPNAEIGLLIANCDSLFKAIFTLAGGGSGGGGGANKEQRVKDLIVEMQEQLPTEFSMIEIKGRVKEKTPYVVFLLQELERMNNILSLMGGGMRELELGLSGALNISDAMDALIGFLFVNSVPPNWLKACGQIGPTGNYNRKNLADWFVNLKERHEQLDEWSKDPHTRPPSVWISGLFNPMGYVTACLQMTARAKSLPLDSMMISTAVMPVFGDEVHAQPEEGTYVHGLFMEGAKWSTEHNSVYESDPKELHPVMPVIQVKGVTAEELAEMKKSGDITYECPVYTTTIRGPTYTFAAPLRTNKPPWVWVLAGVCLVMQPD